VKAFPEKRVCKPNKISDDLEIWVSAELFRADYTHKVVWTKEKE
jgi:hypothetical protein